MSVRFSHPSDYVGDLVLTNPPTKVEWTYNLNTNVVDTFGGQVVQLLSMNFEKLIIEGQFGREGAHGMRIDPKTKQPRDRHPNEYFDLNVGRGANPQAPVGLTQLTEYFRRFFALASQSADRTVKGNLVRERYNQEPMTIHYQTEIEKVERRWTAYPVEFPSYSRENKEFAPKYRVEFEVEEADEIVYNQGLPSELRRLRAAVGYVPYNPFSDPLGAALYQTKQGRLVPNKNVSLDFAKRETDKKIDLAFDELSQLVPATEADMWELIQFGASRAYTGKEKK